MEWPQIIALGLGSGLISALFTFGLGYWKEHYFIKKAQQIDATYLGLRITNSLDRFIIDTGQALSDYNNHLFSKGEEGAPLGKVWSIPQFPEDNSWKYLDLALSARLLNLSTETTLEWNAIKEMAEFGGREEADDALARGYARMGLQAHTLASDIRELYNIPALPQNPGLKWSMHVMEGFAREGREQFTPVAVINVY
ncbi:hypothetical protein FHS85_001875 [Rhodoligotrophos appendicifer]|uniref:hypothetical protein n=1 Tax=Rhodoligotrophos appendicifer TaxID=987056 RepID=UPI001185089A|nr:hypothetical protein [Rhodoligotrophos appendicifer]